MPASSPIKKMILYLGQPQFEVEQARQALADSLGARANPVFVLAKDGPDAERRVDNQKFDAVIIDHQAPRLSEGSFLRGLKNGKNTNGANVLVTIPADDWVLPPELNDADQRLVMPFTVDILVRALAKALATPDLQETQGAACDKQSAFAVDVRVLNAIVKAACFVCQQFGIETSKFHKPQVRKNNEAWSGDIAASIEIQSRLFKGLMIISFEKSVYLKLLENMLGDVQTEINAENSDAIGEIANMILGNAKADFTQYDVGMSIPKMLAKGSVPQCPAGKASIVLTAETAHGPFYIEVIAFPIKSPS
jgi:chemotaxis protein CheX